MAKPRGPAAASTSTPAARTSPHGRPAAPSVAEQLAGSTFQFHPYGPATWGGTKTHGAQRQIQTPLPASIIKDGKWEPLETRMGTLE